MNWVMKLQLESDTGLSLKRCVWGNGWKSQFLSKPKSACSLNRRLVSIGFQSTMNIMFLIFLLGFCWFCFCCCCFCSNDKRGEALPEESVLKSDFRNSMPWGRDLRKFVPLSFKMASGKYFSSQIQTSEWNAGYFCRLKWKCSTLLCPACKIC